MPPRNRIDEQRCRELLAKGLSMVQVAARLGMTRSSVHRVARLTRGTVGTTEGKA